jgi:hypothetical protein
MPSRRQRLCLTIAALFAAVAATVVPGAGAQQRSVIELTLPREPAQDEAVWLQIQVGVLGPGASITVSSSNGELLGSVAPYGSARGAPSATYLVPLPKTAIVNGRIRVQLTVEQAGKPSREPRADEVQNVVPVYVPVTK